MHNRDQKRNLDDIRVTYANFDRFNYNYINVTLQRLSVSISVQYLLNKRKQNIVLNNMNIEKTQRVSVSVSVSVRITEDMRLREKGHNIKTLKSAATQRLTVSVQLVKFKRTRIKTNSYLL